MPSLCAFGALLGLGCKKDAVPAHVETAFIEHMVNFGLSYGTQEEYDFRLGLFQQRDQEINEINADPENTFTVAHNMFSTMSEEERKKRLGLIPNRHFQKQDFEKLDDSNLADSMDWRQRGAVNAVKDQGACGSCWAFAATSSIESAHFLATGQLLSLAEQQFVDCVPVALGCNGGNPAFAMAYAMVSPEDLETDYPYQARTGSCQAGSHQGKVKVAGVHPVIPFVGSQLRAAIAQGPTAVTVAASSTVFQSYRSGIINSSACGYSIDHAITAVGYGTEGGQDYYLVRNSWGTGWGEQGYAKIAGSAFGVGTCAIQSESVRATAH